MTLVLGALTHDYVIQVADRRVTSALTGTLIEDRRNKVVVLCSAFAFSYCGLAEIGLQNTDTWLARRLNERSSGTEAIEHVRESATNELRSCDALRRRHTFVGAGWARDGSDLLAVRCTISNALDATGDWLASAKEEFDVKSQILERNELFKICRPVGAWVEPDWRFELERQVRSCVERSVHPLEIVRLLAQVIRRVSNTNNTVGKNLTVVTLPKSAAEKPQATLETPRQSTSARTAVDNPMFYTANEGDRFEGVMPILVCGGKVLAGSIELGPGERLPVNPDKSKFSLDDVVSEDSLRAYIPNGDEPRYWIRALIEAGGNVGGWGVIVPAVEVCRVFGLTFLRDVDRMFRAAHGWAEDFLREYVERDSMKIPGKFIALEGIVIILTVASLAGESGIADILKSKFGPVSHQEILQLAVAYKQRKKSAWCPILCTTTTEGWAGAPGLPP